MKDYIRLFCYLLNLKHLFVIIHYSPVAKEQKGQFLFLKSFFILKK